MRCGNIMDFYTMLGAASLAVSGTICPGLEEWNVGLPVLEVFCNLTPMTAGSALPAFRFELRYNK